jgi:hypothetical protein
MLVGSERNSEKEAKFWDIFYFFSEESINKIGSRLL